MQVPEAEARVPAPANDSMVLGPLALLSRSQIRLRAGQKQIQFADAGDFAWAVDLVRGWVREQPHLPADDVSRDVLTRPLRASYVVKSGPVWRLLVWVFVAFTLLSWVLQHLIG